MASSSAPAETCQLGDLLPGAACSGAAALTVAWRAEPLADVRLAHVCARCAETLVYDDRAVKMTRLPAVNAAAYGRGRR